MFDDYKHKGLRRKLIDNIRKKGINDEQVLDAMNKIPRHWFMDNAFLEFAYDDKAFPIGEEQTISQPYTVAFQTELLQVEKGTKVLEIGTGSGYQTSVLCELGCKVYSIERQKKLFENTRILLQKLGYRANLYYGDGYLGKEAFAPFDRIIVTCGAPFVPDALVDQLAEGGRMVIPVGDEDQRMQLVTKYLGEINIESFGTFKFVPMLEKKNK